MRKAIAWSIRRELWEHRAIYVAPLVVAGLALLGFLASLGNLPAMAEQLAAVPESQRGFIVATPFNLGASAILFTGYLVAAFYCLDALHAERRDRSILFWKSMPVSDLESVAAKFVIPMVLLPAVALACAYAAQLAMALAALLAFAAKGIGGEGLLGSVPWWPMEVGLLYEVVIHALWFAPIYGYLLAVSTWSRRAPALWAAVPVLGIIFVETIALRTSHFAALVKYRLTGGMAEASTSQDGPVTQLSQLDPVHFLSTPGLWLGLLAAAAFVALAIRLRRYREAL
jgi:ABC-2 type transport system permease protein